MRTCALLVLALLAACGGEPQRDEAAQPVDPAPAAGPPASIAGSWKVTAIDHLPFTDGSGPVLEIGAERIDFDNCKRIGWRYTLEDGRLETERSPPEPPPGEPAPSPCPGALPIPTLQMVSAIDSLERAESAPRGGLRLTGGRGLRSLDLASQ